MSSLSVTQWKAEQTAPRCPGLVNFSVACVTWRDVCPRDRKSIIRHYEYTLKVDKEVILSSLGFFCVFFFILFNSTAVDFIHWMLARCAA